MKKLLLLFLLSVAVESVSAQDIFFYKQEPYVPSKNAEKHHWGIEGNLWWVATTVNAVWEYHCNDWFRLGAGGGLVLPGELSFLGIDVFGRVGFDIMPKSKVSPFVNFDLGFMFTTTFFYGVFPVCGGAPTIGVSCRLRNSDKLSVGIGGFVAVSIFEGIMGVNFLR